MRETVSRERAASNANAKHPGGGAGGGYGGGGGASNYGASQGDNERTRLIEQEHRDKQEMMGNQVDYSTSLITEREDAIADIESTMLEVNEIYKDLSTLVVEQGAALGTRQPPGSFIVNLSHSRFPERARALPLSCTPTHPPPTHV